MKWKRSVQDDVNFKYILDYFVLHVSIMISLNTMYPSS